MVIREAHGELRRTNAELGDSVVGVHGIALA
jgi:hypothetical protein